MSIKSVSTFFLRQNIEKKYEYFLRRDFTKKKWDFTKSLKKLRCFQLTKICLSISFGQKCLYKLYNSDNCEQLEFKNKTIIKYYQVYIIKEK